MKSGEGSPRKPLFSQARSAREATQANLRHEAIELADKGRPWHWYARDVRSYLRESENFFPGCSRELMQAIDETHRAGLQAVVADIAGGADASSLGVERTICATLSEPGFKPKEGQTFVKGNLLTRAKQDELLELATAPGGSLVAVFFSPGGGGSAHYSENDYVLAQTQRLLLKLYDVLAKGGQLHIRISLVSGYERIAQEIREQFGALGATIKEKDKNFLIVK